MSNNLGFVEVKTFHIPYYKEVWGYVEVLAKDEKDAQERFESGDCEEFDNKSSYEYDDMVEV